VTEPSAVRRQAKPRSRRCLASPWDDDEDDRDDEDDDDEEDDNEVGVDAEVDESRTRLASLRKAPRLADAKGSRPTNTSRPSASAGDPRLRGVPWVGQEGRAGVEERRGEA